MKMGKKTSSFNVNSLVNFCSNPNSSSTELHFYSGLVLDFNGMWEFYSIKTSPENFLKMNKIFELSSVFKRNIPS